MIKSFKKILSKSLGFFYVYLSKLLPSRGRVLMLHWVGDDMLDEEYEPYRISVEQFELLLNWLKQKNTIRLEDWEKETDFYALTIDDVPESFYLNAFPLLKEYAIPFTLFINTSLLGEEGYINIEQLQEMAQCDLSTIGSHGDAHSMYALFTKDSAVRDLKASKIHIENLINKPVEIFAYPYGSYYACGYKNKYLACRIYNYAFGTIPSPITSPSLFKKYFLPRINVDETFLRSIR